MSRLRFFLLIVMLILPQAFPFASGPIEANPTALNTISAISIAYPPAVANNCITSSPKPSVYYGVHVPKWLDKLDRKLYPFENDAKKKVSIVMWYQGWGVPDKTRYFQKVWMDNIRNNGSIPMVTWEPWFYNAPKPKEIQPDYQLIDIINGNFDPYIQKWADDSKHWGYPYFLRFAAEMNGTWFPWSERVNGNKSGEYAQAWRHVHDIFTSTGVTNVTWVWSPNIEYDNGSKLLEGLYPGDMYVDWLGMDGYNWGTVSHPNVTGWQTFSEVFSQTYTHITTLSTKPLMVAETASTKQGGSKSDWITDAYSTQIPCNFKKIKAVIWFNENKETDWRIESSLAAQNAFATAIHSNFYAMNKYKSLSQSPIPVPLAFSRQVSLSAQDGWVLESTETSNEGGSMNNTATILRIGDDPGRKQYRSILSSKTDSLPDNAVITSVKLKLKRSSVSPAGTNPIALLQGIFVDICTGFFDTQPTLQLTDFQAIASKTDGPFMPTLSDRKSVV